MKIGLGAVRSAAGDWIPPGAAVAHVMPCGSDVPANCHGENCIGCELCCTVRPPLHVVYCGSKYIPLTVLLSNAEHASEYSYNKTNEMH